MSTDSLTEKLGDVKDRGHSRRKDNDWEENKRFSPRPAIIYPPCTYKR